MGGVGKTTLAIALCHDEQVIEAFPDGILWATLGPQADVLSAQAVWGEVLGVDLTTLPDAQARAARLRSLLHRKCCLIVIDDVWDTIHLPLMQAGRSVPPW
jgi:predicted ATPase